MGPLETQWGEYSIGYELIFPTLESVHKTALQYPLFTLENDRCHKTFPSDLRSYLGHNMLLTL